MRRAKEISLTELATTFVPFGLGLVAATLAPEMAEDILHQRIIYATWVSLTLFIPALCLYVLPGESRSHRSYWLLTWTFSYLAYMAHFLWAVGGQYGFSVVKVYQGQGPLIATSNFVVTILWTLDVARAWLRPSEQWRGLGRALTHFLVLVIFVASSLVLFGGPVRIFGVVMVGSLVISLLARYNAHQLARAR